jgi:hypothetical protein
MRLKGIKCVERNDQLRYHNGNFFRYGRYTRQEEVKEPVYLCKLTGYMLDYQGSIHFAAHKDPRNEVNELYDYREKWLTHLNRTENNRLPKLVAECKPKGFRDIRLLSKMDMMCELAQA